MNHPQYHVGIQSELYSTKAQVVFFLQYSIIMDRSLAHQNANPTAKVTSTIFKKIIIIEVLLAQ
jgi:hypothetical protein